MKQNPPTPKGMQNQIRTLIIITVVVKENDEINQSPFFLDQTIK